MHKAASQPASLASKHGSRHEEAWQLQLGGVTTMLYKIRPTLVAQIVIFKLCHQDSEYTCKFR